MEDDFQTEAMPHLDALYRYALRLTRNDKDAEDLLQDTFLRAFRFWGNYQKGTNCKAWLYRIMKNLFLNKVDKKKRSPDSTSLDDTEEWYLYSQLKESGPDAAREDPAAIFELKDWAVGIFSPVGILSPGVGQGLNMLRICSGEKSNLDKDALGERDGRPARGDQERLRRET